MPLVTMLLAAAATQAMPICWVERNILNVLMPANLSPRMDTVSVLGKAWVYLKDVDLDAHYVSFGPETRRLRINTRTQTGLYFDELGMEQEVKAFPRKGKYEVVFGDHIRAVTPETKPMRCTVRLR